MSKKKRKLSGDEIRSAKKAAILNENKRSKLPLIAVALCAVFIAAGAAVYTLAPFGKGIQLLLQVSVPPPNQTRWNMTLPCSTTGRHSISAIPPVSKPSIILS